jgi:hypothetical protein
MLFFLREVSARLQNFPLHATADNIVPAGGEM